MQPKIRKHVLVALLGRTPQIITETLFALVVINNIPIQELIILTTADGKKEAEQNLLDHQKGWLNRLIGDYPDAFTKFNRQRVQLITARDNFGELPDIRNLDDNAHFVNRLMQFMREKTSRENTVLYCSLAGGRKTMSVYLALAMQFFGRPQDRLYHVLVSPPEFESNPEFYYPPPQPITLKLQNGRQISTADARIDLVEVPYIRLRSKMEYLFGHQPLSFTEMVNCAQAELEQFPDLPPLVVDTQHRVIIIGNKEILFPPKEFTIYWFCAERSKNRPDSIAVGQYEQYFEPVQKGDFYREETLERLNEIYKIVRPGAESFNPENTQSIISKIRRKIEETLNDSHVSAYYVISSVGLYACKKYGIKLDKSKIAIN
ncbi:MAG: TIGR02584 family CRISPR-associated protein [Calditrichaeota bacterium]|nr:MAG: TIGR02584 family CRISPR-associated protein [Calditrichota bacterium]